jgi:hypothetical protein
MDGFMMRRNVLLGAILSSFIFLLSGCSSHVYRGDGHWVTQKRPVAVFDRINISGHFKLLYQDHLRSHLSVSGDKNLLPFVRTVVKNGELVIDTQPGARIDPSKVITIHLSNETLEQLSSSGVNEIDLTQLRENVLHVNASGGEKVSLQGRVNDVVYNCSGVSRIQANRLVARDAGVRLSGASVLNAYVNHRLDVNVSGAAKVRYTGSPEVVSHVSGMASVLPSQA